MAQPGDEVALCRGGGEEAGEEQAAANGAHSASGAPPGAANVRCYGGLVDKREAERLERMAGELSGHAPAWAAEALRQAAPTIGVVGAAVETVVPPVFSFYCGLYRCYQALPHTAASCMWGMGLCFFGGRYPLALAAMEAFKLTGGSEVALHVETIREVAEKVQEANEEDNKKDDDGDGTPDVDQLGGRSLLRRKADLLLRCVEPGQLSEAVHGLFSGYMGVIAALQTKYARTTALAHSVGESVRPAAGKLLGPAVLAVTPPDYHKWVNPALNCICKAAAALLAWRIQGFLSTFQSALAGGLLATRSAMALLHRDGTLMVGDRMLDEVLGWALAACGMYYQVLLAGEPPLFFFPVCWPLGMLESWLRWSVMFTGSAAA